MTNIDIIRMAREAGFHRPVPADGYMGLAYDRREGRETGGSLERFAAIVRADEREQGQKWFDAVTAQHKQEILAEREACAKECKFGRSSADIEQAIRARSNT